MPESFDATRIPASRVPLSQGDNKEVSREWYRFLFNAFVLLGSGSNTTSLTDLQLGPPSLSSTQILQAKYGSFSDTTTQTAVVANTPYAVKFNTSDISSGVYTGGSDSSQIYVTRRGYYNFQFSLQLYSISGASAKDIYIWADINGSSVANSATKVTLQGASLASVAAWNFVLNMNAGDYFRLMWATTDTNAEILAAAASGSIPAIPSAILTVTDNIGVK